MTNTVPLEKVPAPDFYRKVTPEFDSEFWAYFITDVEVADPWVPVRVTGFRSLGSAGRWYAMFEYRGDPMTFAPLDDLRLPGWTCPECGEAAVEKPSTRYGGIYGAPFSHLDGEPLCPVVGEDGYEPAQPV